MDSARDGQVLDDSLRSAQAWLVDRRGARYYSDPRVLDGTLVAVVESGDLGNLAEFDRFVGLEMEEWRVALGAAAHTLDPGDVGADGWFARPS